MATRQLLRTSRSDVSARKTYDLIDEPVGADYDALLDCALTQCATFVLAVPRDSGDPAAREVLDELAPHLGSTSDASAVSIHRDTILAYFERRIESHIEALTVEVQRYAHTILEEGREDLVEALAGWLASGEEARVHAAVEVIGALRLTELRSEVLALQRGDDAADEPDVYRSNVVLRARWRVRRRRLLERTLQRLSEERVETNA